MSAPVPPSLAFTAPGRPALEAENIPAGLRACPQWVCWEYVTRDEKPTKFPVNPRTGTAADTTDPSTWASFEEAIAAFGGSDRYAGVGFVFTADGPFAGVDLDGCIDDGGGVAGSAREIIDSLGSYTEVSPSGRGVKVFVIARKPAGARCKSQLVPGFKETEVYDQARFFTVTGVRLAGTPETVNERQVQLEALCARLWPPKPVVANPRPVRGGGFPGDDDALIERAGSARNGDLFRALWAGDTSAHGDDDNRADLALGNLLAFWTGRDADRMDRLFRRSGLYRPKWDERRGDRTYGQMTVELAIKDCRESYSAGSGGPSVVPGEGDDGLIPLGQHDPATGRLVLSPRRTLPTAESYVREFNQHADGRTLHGYGGLLMEWRGNRYCEVEEGGIRHRLQPWLHKALRYVVNRRTGALELADFESNPTTVKQALDTIRSFVHLPAETVAPSWLTAEPGRPPAAELLPCRSMTLHIPTGSVLAPTPALFTINALDFDYDPDPEPPHRWIKFLEQLWEDDLESVQLLQEWMGYVLIADTSQHKMLILIGPPRSGKGTIGRIMARLVGIGNVAGPTTGSLCGPFGLQPLIGKSLAIVSDARFSGEHVSTAFERLLCISGEDTLSIDRKFLGAVNMKLPTRFMFLTNELPRLNDASSALAKRFLMLRLTNSFYGRENVALTNELLAELPGILLWAIEGWKRLNARGHFVQPASVEDAVRDLEDLASPVGAFVRERCVVATGRRAFIDELYREWQAWCARDGRQLVTNKQSFGRDLAAAVPGIMRRRGSHLIAFYEGIGLACPEDR